MKSKILFFVLGLAFLIRWLRPDLVGFYFDQGRDALVIWDLLHKGKLFLIGPTTGVEGIFLGPFYYYLLAPVYWLGKGDPVFPIRFMAILNLGSLWLLYKLGEKYFSKSVGLSAVILAGFSYHYVLGNRWLANPTPLSFFAVLTFWFVAKLIAGQAKWFPVVCLLIGLGVQLEAASAVFFIPSLLITLWIFRKSTNLKARDIFLGFLAFGITLVPQLWFNFRHQNILFSAFFKFLISEKSFIQSPLVIIPERLLFYFNAFTRQLSPAGILERTAMFIFVLVGITKKWSRLIQNPAFKFILIWLFTPMVLLLLYTGNNGYVWDYYFTGVYPLFFLLVAAVIGKRLIGIIFILVFLTANLFPLRDYFMQEKESRRVNLGSSLRVVDWIYEDSKDLPFNVDAYVPPMIPYTYDYLFKWRGETKYKTAPTETRIKNLYTLYEVDPGHPQLFKKWQDRQNGIGKIVFEKSFGAIVVERRERIDLNEK